MAPTAKLTKRQKKGIAFRERKQGKSDDNLLDVTVNLEDEFDVPSLEDPALVDATQGEQGDQVSAEALVGKRKARTEGDEAESRVVVAEKKRKRKVGEDKAQGREPNQPKPKRRKGSDGSPLGGMEQPVEDDVGTGETGNREKTKQRFILFLGNLKYTTTLEAIQSHFSACVPPPIIRLLTPKPSTKSPSKSAIKSKGCAFLEFKHRGVLQQGLKLHHSQLDGRQINVELTAGGGGKGATRLKKLQERNKGLEGQRRKRQEPGKDAQAGGAQRFSATSGEEQIHTHKQTWTIGDTEENRTHRGGQKHKRGSRKQGSVIKDFRTGVNAIPVG